MPTDEQATPDAASVDAEANQPDLDKQQAELRQLSHDQAGRLQELSASVYLYGSASSCLRRELENPFAYKVYFDQLIKQAGDPDDPIETMLLEQIVLSHHALGRLHMEAAQAEGIEQKKVLNGAIARLSAEFRRFALAVKTYRTPSETGQVQGDRQSSHPNSNGKDPTKLNGESRNGSARRSTRDTEVESNNRNGHANRITDHMQESAPRRCGKT